VKVSGSAVLHASPDQVWAAITDPAVLATVIPGCDALTPLADDKFGLTVTLGVASIKGSYVGEVAFSEMQKPSSLTMRANGSGGPGTIDTTVAVVLADNADGTTKLDYDADAMVGGMVGGVGQRVLAGVAKKTAGMFFAAIDDVLTGAKTVSAATETTLAAASDSAAPRPVAAPATPAMPGGSALIGAAAFGAVSMLAGVLVGARIARRR